MTRVAIFVDGANMFYTQRHLGWFVDYARLLARLVGGDALYNAFYYSAVNPDRPTEEGFLRFLTNTGYTVRRKPLRRLTDPETGAAVEQANLDVELVVDLFDTLPLYDKAILCTGDGDFERAVELLRSKGKTITVVGTQGTMSLELRNAADAYLDLVELRPEVERPRPAGAPPGPAATAE